MRELCFSAAPLRSLSRSLAPTGISPTTFRRRGCTPRFGEDLVINHDAAISQSNVRSLVGREWREGGGQQGYRGLPTEGRGGEGEEGRGRVGHLLITSAPINTASNKEGGYSTTNRSVVLKKPAGTKTRFNVKRTGTCPREIGTRPRTFEIPR